MPRRPSAATARALAAVLLLLLLVPQRAEAQQDPRQAREEVRKQKAAAASDVNALKADASTVQQALADLQANVRGQEALLADASLAADVAAASAAKARAEADAARAHVEELKGQLKQVAVDAYVSGNPQDDDGSSITEDPDPSRTLAKQALVRFRSSQGTAVLDQLKAAQEDADAAQAVADRESAEAERKRSEISTRTAQVKAARDQQAAYAAQVEARLDRRLSEAAALEAQDKTLSQQIAAQEAALAARVSRSGGGGGGGPAFTGGGVALRTVHGITVAESIADQLDRMINAAAADGIQLGGSGYRDPAAQQRLREQNCANPSTDPPSACSPPTARPGSSMHERGLAVDFSANGHLIQSRSDPGYQWLAGHAASYGFYNLPSEPWHWSTTGD